ncbi:MAG: M20/M25/M40 family metallo-hydrolase [Anaerolineales bacterium]|jgi:tripeptide aminopeptidase
MDDSLIQKVLNLAVEIQQIPAPTFDEARRAAFIRERFEAEGLGDVSVDEVGNVYARLPGGGKAPPLVISAHMDTVFPAGTDLSVVIGEGKISGPGIGDNALGVAGLFGLLWGLQNKKGNGQTMQFPGDLWLVANVGEEGLGNLCGMKAVVDRFKDQVLGYVVLEGMAFGQIYHQGLNVKRYQITVHTPGGHSWVDYGKPSAVHILANLITQLESIPLPPKPRTTMNVGMISGGTSVNTIAAQASLELDLRSEGAQALAAVSNKVEKLVQEANREDVRVLLEIIGERPPGKISIRHPLVRLAVRCLQQQGLTPHFNAGSTDANIPLSRGLPAICLGLTTGSGAHTLDEQIYTDQLSKGVDQLVCLVISLFQAFNRE